MKEIENTTSEEKRNKLQLKYGTELNKKMIIVEERLGKINSILRKNMNTHSTDQGAGDGNSLTYKHLVNFAVKGDILLGDNKGKAIQGPINHAGIYNGKASKINRNVILSAQTYSGVLIESTKQWSEDNDFVYILTVKNLSDKEKAEAYDTVAAVAEIGENYTVWTLKYTTEDWYCSKIPSGRITLN